VAEVAANLDADIIINLQGDEPLIDPEALDLLPELLVRNPGSDMATLATPITSRAQWENPNCVKVVCDTAGGALYFSRSPIPYVRDGEPAFNARPAQFLQHLGLYAYRRTFLLQLAQMPPHPLEQVEKLEQLRVLALGQRISVGLVATAGRGVDTLEDYEAFLRIYRENRFHQAA
jgi:3-deoxy-manno-octulosonate cytidylyltransferase (CMP-KDO synthetase)